MKSYSLSTELLNHILCVGMYESWLSGDSEYEIAAENFLEEHPGFQGDLPIEYDNEANEQAIEDALANVLENEVKPFLSQFGVQEITLGAWYHPQYYNFETDSIGLNFETADNFLAIAIQKIQSWKGNSDIAMYIDRNFKSRDGFASFCPESLSELATEMRSGMPTVQATGEYIALLLHEQYGDNNLQDALISEWQTKNADIWYVDETRSHKAA